MTWVSGTRFPLFTTAVGVAGICLSFFSCHERPLAVPELNGKIKKNDKNDDNNKKQAWLSRMYSHTLFQGVIVFLIVANFVLTAAEVCLFFFFIYF